MLPAYHLLAPPLLGAHPARGGIVYHSTNPTYPRTLECDGDFHPDHYHQCFLCLLRILSCFSLFLFFLGPLCPFCPLWGVREGFLQMVGAGANSYLQVTLYCVTRHPA